MEKFKTFTRPTPFYSRIYGAGVANGYVAIPKGHFLHGMDYDDIHKKYDISVHGGITFCGHTSQLLEEPIEGINQDDWVFGFDTCHFGDTEILWPLNKVEEEAENLAEQLSKLKPKDQ